MMFDKLWSHVRQQFDSLNVSVVFCTLWRHARVQIDSIGLPTLNVSIVFYTHWQHARVQIDYSIADIERSFHVLHTLDARLGTD